MKPLNILIVEDEILIADLIEDYLSEVGHKVAGAAISFDEAVENYHQTQPDLILLDIRLYGEKSGLDFARYLTTLEEQTPIVFLTSQFDEKTLQQALTTNPCGYLAKPIHKESLWTTIATAHQLSQRENSSITSLVVPYGKTQHQLQLDEILYLEADHIYVNIYLVNGNIIRIRKPLKHFLEVLKDSFIIQCHRGYMVNKHQIRYWGANSLTLSSGQEVPVSRRKRNSLMDL